MADNKKRPGDELPAPFKAKKAKTESGHVHVLSETEDDIRKNYSSASELLTKNGLSSESGDIGQMYITLPDGVACDIVPRPSSTPHEDRVKILNFFALTTEMFKHKAEIEAAQKTWAKRQAETEFWEQKYHEEKKRNELLQSEFMAYKTVRGLLELAQPQLSRRLPPPPQVPPPEIIIHSLSSS